MKVRIKFMGKTKEQTGCLSAFQTTFLLLQWRSMGLWMCEKGMLHATPKCAIYRKTERGKGISNIIEIRLTCRSSQEEGRVHVEFARLKMPLRTQCRNKKVLILVRWPSHDPLISSCEITAKSPLLHHLLSWRHGWEATEACQSSPPPTRPPHYCKWESF